MLFSIQFSGLNELFVSSRLSERANLIGNYKAVSVRLLKRSNQLKLIFVLHDKCHDVENIQVTYTHTHTHTHNIHLQT